MTDQNQQGALRRSVLGRPATSWMDNVIDVINIPLINQQTPLKGPQHLLLISSIRARIANKGWVLQS